MIYSDLNLLKPLKLHVESNRNVGFTLVEQFLIVRLTASIAVHLESFSPYIRLKPLEVTCISNKVLLGRTSRLFREKAGSTESISTARSKIRKSRV